MIEITYEVNRINVDYPDFPGIYVYVTFRDGPRTQGVQRRLPIDYVDQGYIDAIFEDMKKELIKKIKE